MNTIEIAEQAVIAAAMLVPDRVLHVVDIEPQHFADEWLGRVWGRIQTLSRGGKEINPISVAEQAQREGAKESEIGLDFMVRLVDDCPGAAGVKSYADAIRSAWRDREARKIAATMVADLGGEGDAVGTAITALMGLDRDEGAFELDSKAALQAAYREIETAFAANGALIGVPTGFKKLDETLGGFHRGDLIFVQARPAMGKTALMLAFDRAAGKAGFCTGVVSAEQPASQLAMRQIAIESGVPLQAMRAATMDDDEWGRVTTAMQRASQRSGRIYDRSAPSLNAIAAQARKWVHRDGVRILFVDYLQRLTCQAQSRREEVSQLARGLKTLARDLNVPVVALAQSVRDVDNRQNKMPQLADIAESADCEREADVVIGLHKNDDGTADLGITKNRHGPCGQMKIAFLARSLRFGDLTNFQDRAA